MAGFPRAAQRISDSSPARPVWALPLRTPFTRRIDRGTAHRHRTSPSDEARAMIAGA